MTTHRFYAAAVSALLALSTLALLGSSVPVLAGDLNSAGDGTGVTYNSLTGAGFVDAAAIADLGDAPTCCQAPDLLNETSMLDSRSDYVLSRPRLGVLDAHVVGAEQGDRTPSGFWPSDHAGVAITLGIPMP